MTSSVSDSADRLVCLSAMSCVPVTPIPPPKLDQYNQPDSRGASDSVESSARDDEYRHGRLQT